MKAVKCKQCDFWVQIGDTNAGQCRRFPPTLSIQLVPRPGKNVISGGAQQVSLEPINLVNWPTTKEDDFCGEHT